jgi:hypothetical protein
MTTTLGVSLEPFDVLLDLSCGSVLFPPPLWGPRRAKLALEVREGGKSLTEEFLVPPSPPLSHKGGESRPFVLRE